MRFPEPSGTSASTKDGRGRANQGRRIKKTVMDMAGRAIQNKVWTAEREGEALGVGRGRGVEVGTGEGEEAGSPATPWRGVCKKRKSRFTEGTTSC